MSITKKQFLSKEPRKVEKINGVYVGSVPPITQSRRESMLRDPSSGQLASDALFKTGIYSLIDQVCMNESGDPLFSEEDYEALCHISDSRKLAPLFEAVAEFNSRNPVDPNGSSE